MESQMVLVTHGTQDDNSSDDGSSDAPVPVKNRMSTLNEADNEEDSQEEPKFWRVCRANRKVWSA